MYVLYMLARIRFPARRVADLAPPKYLEFTQGVAHARSNPARLGISVRGLPPQPNFVWLKRGAGLYGLDAGSSHSPENGSHKLSRQRHKLEQRRPHAASPAQLRQAAPPAESRQESRQTASSAESYESRAEPQRSFTRSRSARQPTDSRSESRGKTQPFIVTIESRPACQTSPRGKRRYA